MAKYIESATKTVEESGIEKAKTELETGIKHFETAQTLSKEEGKTEEAMAELKQASKLIHNAVRIAKQPKMIEKMIKYLDKSLEKAKQIVDNSDNAEAKTLLAEGETQLNNGKELAKSDDFDQAKQELKNASKSIHKAIWMVKGKKKHKKNKKHSMNMERWIERVTKQYEKVSEIVGKSNSADATAKLTEAKKHIDNATQLISQDNKDKEVSAELRAASKLIHEAYMIAKLPEKIEKWIKHLDKRVEKVKELVDKSTDPKAQEAFNAGVALIDDAKKLQAEGKSKEAIAKLKDASKQIHKAMRIAKPKKKRPNKVNP
jgi:tetratricopeptide (TPR) repeat protein